MRGTNLNASDFDSHGCLEFLNNAAKSFNRRLQVLCEDLRSEMMNAMIVYVDVFAIKYVRTISLPILLLIYGMIIYISLCYHKVFLLS
jgi:hypothetical protein